MTSIHPSFFLYSLTLKHSNAYNGAIVGQFTGSKRQDIIAYTARTISVLTLDAKIGKISEIFRQEGFGIIRSIQPFRLFGSSNDMMIIASDSGKITIVEYDAKKEFFVQIHQETFGKSGIRRVTPGEYLTVDPKGRTCMIASVEKNKLVYILNRDSEANITISSPLEAHKANTILVDIKSLDVGFENPIFAALEVDYGEVEDQDDAYAKTEKVLVYYELDLGLNHVVRRFSEAVDRFAHKLIPIPGGKDGPSGVLVCSKGKIVYYNSAGESLSIPIPSRNNESLMICCYVVHKMKGSFFLLVQNEFGDLFKISMDLSDDKQKVLDIFIKYFDTVAPALALLVFKAGYLFVVAEYGNHELYQFLKLGDEDSETIYRGTESNRVATFVPKQYDNIAPLEQIRCLNPLIDFKLLNLTREDLPQFYGVAGSRDRSCFFKMKRGIKTMELVSSELPAIPTAIWTIKRSQKEDFDAYIVLTFSNGTLVLSIGNTVEEVPDSGFLLSVPTLTVQQMGQDVLVQVNPRGVRIIRADKSVNEWKVPSHRTVVAAATNNRQVILGLSSSEIVYFEMDMDGQLQEYQQHKEMQSTISALGIAQVPEGRQRYPFLAVGCDDSTVRIISLDPETTLDSLSVQALSSPSSSLCLNTMYDNNLETDFLHIGLSNGVYLRTVLDTNTGQLMDTRTRFLGSRPVQLFRVTVEQKPCVLALSSCTWLSYTQKKALKLSPLDTEPLDHACSFSSEQCTEGIIGVQSQNLKILSIEDTTDELLCEQYPLKQTPRHFTFNSNSTLFYIGQGDGPVVPSENVGYSSTIQVFDPKLNEFIQEIKLDVDEAITCQNIVNFIAHNEAQFLAVSTAQELVISPLGCKKSYISLYKVSDDGRSLKFMHKTELDHVCKAMIAFHGRLLAGVGKSLRIYDIGMKRMLRKSELIVPNFVVSLHTQGDRIIIGDVQQSVSFAVYKDFENKIIVFADDTVPRHITASTMLDYDTVAGGDRFGNIWVVRCPEKASQLSDNDHTGSTLLNEKTFINGAAHRLDMLAHYYLNDIPTSIQKACLVNGGRDVMLYTGISGTIGICIPLASRDDVDFFKILEAQMRVQNPPIAGRDHMVYRSYYMPVKSVIDGDLCEQYLMLSKDTKERIAKELERNSADVIKKIEDIRGRNF